MSLRPKLEIDLINIKLILESTITNKLLTQSIIHAINALRRSIIKNG